MSINSGYEKAHNNIAIIFQEQKNYDEAFLHYNKAIAIKPNYCEAILNLGELFFEKNELNKALKYFKKALTINPNLYEAYNNIGNVFYEKGQSQKALNFYNKALSMNSFSYQSYDNIGNIFKQNGNLLKAIEYFEKALSIMPNLELVRAKKLHLQASICDWNGIKKDLISLNEIGTNNQSVTPLTMLSFEDCPISQKNVQKYIQKIDFYKNNCHLI